MFENPNLDRYLRKAQNFLDQDKYDSAILVLQDVIEGNTVEFLAPGGGTPTDGGVAEATPGIDGAKVEGAKPTDKPTEKEPKHGKTAAELDAAQSVFSQDGRVYRPVRRLCHEILAKLPPVGIELYRASYEVAAKEMLEAALLDGSISALERVANRYFITIPAGKAMVALADRLINEGRYRSAVQVLRDLIEVYPKENRQRLGVSEVWCRFKIALCLRMAGELAAAQAAVQELATAFPEESLRIVGELQAVKDLPQSEVFASEVLAAVSAAQRDAGASWLTDSTASLVPLWQYRFHNPDPYREPKAVNNDGQVFWSEGAQATTMPHANRYGPGTWVTFSSGKDGEAPRAMFLEHYRLRIADALSGVLLKEGGGVEEPPTPRENYPRVRIAASDYALLRPVEDEARRYIVMGYSRNASQSEDVLKASELVAYQRDSLELAWTSSQWLDGEDGLRDVTFLAAPTVFGERLLLPGLRRGSYTLECLDRSTGRPEWHTLIHSGGTSFYKAPGAPVAVQGGIAFVTTNAGCMAAVDAFAGDLRWIRRYEREDPMRPRLRPKSRAQNENARYGVQFLQNELTGFLPNDILVHDGLVVMAPSDGNMMMCLDGATGQVVWMLDATTRYAPYGSLRVLVGATATDLFALSDKYLVCISLQGGLVKWDRELPVWNGPKTTGRGRGVVLGDGVVVPGEREVLVFDVSNEKPMRRLPLPAFGEGRDPMAGSFHLVSSGPWLAVGYAGGVELFSSEPALLQMAQRTNDPLQKVDYLLHAGAMPAAEQFLRGWLPTVDVASEPCIKGAAQLLAIVRERALAAARGGDKGAVQALDSVLPFAIDHTVRLNWHLARLEVCKEAGDLHGYEQEQQRLYDFMEGKG
jgi:outer membrane protein assembly factor BamB/tetratricopeptide (TPR) repeat protein